MRLSSNSASRWGVGSNLLLYVKHKQTDTSVLIKLCENERSHLCLLMNDGDDAATDWLILLVFGWTKTTSRDCDYKQLQKQVGILIFSLSFKAKNEASLFMLRPNMICKPMLGAATVESTQIDFHLPCFICNSIKASCTKKKNNNSIITGNCSSVIVPGFPHLQRCNYSS